MSSRLSLAIVCLSISALVAFAPQSATLGTGPQPTAAVRVGSPIEVGLQGMPVSANLINAFLRAHDQAFAGPAVVTNPDPNGGGTILIPRDSFYSDMALTIQNCGDTTITIFEGQQLLDVPAGSGRAVFVDLTLGGPSLTYSGDGSGTSIAFAWSLKRPAP